MSKHRGFSKLLSVNGMSLWKQNSLFSHSNNISFRRFCTHYAYRHTPAEEILILRTSTSDKAGGNPFYSPASTSTISPAFAASNSTCCQSSICREPTCNTSGFQIVSPFSHNPIPSISLALVNHRRWNSSSGFIRSVMEQVEKDLANQPKLRKAMEDLRTSADEGRTLRNRMKESIQKKWLYTQVFATDASKMFFQSAETIRIFSDTISTKYPLLYKGVLQLQIILRKLFEAFKVFFDRVKLLVEKLQDENQGEKRTAAWRRAQAIKRYKEQQSNMASDASKQEAETTAETMRNEAGTPLEPEEQIPENTALILAKTSAWDRFGTRLKDMPFLYSFFENPFIGKLFGETEIAASIRDMKTADPTFRFPEFMETVEQVVAPHVVDCFLHGDSESLRLHFGEAAFSAVIASIKERETMKVSLDTSVLQLRGLELRGAKRDEEGTPWFIFTFTTQQINCLRDMKGNVVTGAIDDIREVVYSIAITKHPEPDTEGLHYPWMVKELAIIGNTPCW